MLACRDRFFPLVLLLAFVGETTGLRAHDELARRMLAAGDPSRAKWFETLKTPAGESCCNLSDCRQTRAQWRGDTEGWWALIDGTWRPIPADKVLTSPKSIDGAAYLCSGLDSRGDDPDGDASTPAGNITSVFGAIYCFVPPDLGS